MLNEVVNVDKHFKINIEEKNFRNSSNTPFVIGMGNICELFQEPLYSQMDELKPLGFFLC